MERFGYTKLNVNVGPYVFKHFNYRGIYLYVKLENHMTTIRYVYIFLITATFLHTLLVSVTQCHLSNQFMLPIAIDAR